MDNPMLNHKLNKHQIDYVIFHLGHSLELSEQISKSIVFDQNVDGQEKKIVFPLSDKEIDMDNIIFRNDIPILFPVQKTEAPYILQNGNLIFNDDLLKSAFYLLSGIQEYQSSTKDFLGRFPFEASIQKKVGFIHKPIVNYYFELIIEGIEAFGKLHGIPVKRKRIFPETGFMLTHDIDKIDTYNFPDFIFKIKQLLGLTGAKYPYSRIFRTNFKYIVNYLNPFHRKNPFWNFDFLMHQDEKLGFKSSFYFLHKDLKGDSYYTFKDKRIQRLIPELIKNGHEVGLHGSIRTSTNFEAMKNNLRLLEEVTSEKIWGGRQHRLMFQMPLTLKIHKECGLKYDSTLGYAGHEGFRNSYCMPFKLYDFENDRMIDVWEIPLTVMDGTLFSYRKLNNDDAFASVESLFEETRKFNGVFTLLWHNSFFDDDLYPELTSFYKKTLAFFNTNNVKSYTGAEITKIMDKHAR
jgi:hypothetical protein